MENRKAAGPSRFARSLRVPRPIFSFSLFDFLLRRPSPRLRRARRARRTQSAASPPRSPTSQPRSRATASYSPSRFPRIPSRATRSNSRPQLKFSAISRPLHPVPRHHRGAAAIPTLLVTIPSAMVDQYGTHGQILYGDELNREDFTQHPGAASRLHRSHSHVRQESIRKFQCRGPAHRTRRRSDRGPQSRSHSSRRGPELDAAANYIDGFRARDRELSRLSRGNKSTACRAAKRELFIRVSGHAQSDPDALAHR